MKKVMIATPCYDGKIAAHYADSMLNSVILGSKEKIIIRPVYLPHQAVIQYARNELLKLFLASEFEQLVFIDSDQAWKPEDLIKLIKSDKDFVGAPVIRKAEREMYNIKCVDNPLKINKDGYMVVDAVGTGMLKLSRNCVQKVWDISQEYTMDFQKEPHRMAFEIGINDKGQTVSEDNMFCFKWQELGGKVYIDTSIDPYHIGDKIWKGNFAGFVNKVLESRQKSEDTV
jgi:hypothetical protein